MIKEIIKYALGLLIALILGYIIRIYMCQWFGIEEPTIIHSLLIILYLRIWHSDVLPAESK